MLCFSEPVSFNPTARYSLAPRQVNKVQATLPHLDSTLAYEFDDEYQVRARRSLVTHRPSHFSICVGDFQ